MNGFFDHIDLNTVLNAFRVVLEARRQLLEWLAQRRRGPQREAGPPTQEQPPTADNQPQHGRGP